MFYLKYYKKYFFIVLTVLVILAGFTLWIYRPAHKDNTENTNKKIEKFTKKDEEISYQYLSKLALKTNSICRFVSGIPKKKEIKSKSESRKYYNMNGNLEKEIIEFNVNFKTRANNPYQMKIKWCEYSPKKPDDKGICFLSVRYLGKTEKNLQGKVRTYAEIK